MLSKFYSFLFKAFSDHHILCLFLFIDWKFIWPRGCQPTASKGKKYNMECYLYRSNLNAKIHVENQKSMSKELWSTVEIHPPIAMTGFFAEKLFGKSISFSFLTGLEIFSDTDILPQNWAVVSKTDGHCFLCVRVCGFSFEICKFSAHSYIQLINYWDIIMLLIILVSETLAISKSIYFIRPNNKKKKISRFNDLIALNEWKKEDG